MIFPPQPCWTKPGIETILVGDSLGMVILGYDSTVPVTVDEMLHHCKAVCRGVKYAFVIGDMPFMSYNISIEEAIRNAGRFIKETGCDAVKLEGGTEMAPVVKAVVNAGIPVCGHIGLTPQTISKLSGHRVQGRDEAEALALIESARALEKAGAFMVVLELVPESVAARVTEAVGIPTIGIGAGPHCDGQVLVTNDLLGLYEKFVPSFVKQYLKLAPQIKSAVSEYISEVKAGAFPGPEHTRQ